MRRNLVGVRLYDPAPGRFLEVDPVEGGSANDYDYAMADPCNNQDLDGRASRRVNRALDWIATDIATIWERLEAWRLRKQGIILTQSKVNLSPPSARDWALAAAFFFFGSVALMLVIVKTKGFRRFYEAMPFLRKIRVPSYEEQRWGYLLLPILLIVVALLLAFAATRS